MKSSMLEAHLENTSLVKGKIVMFVHEGCEICHSVKRVFKDNIKQGVIEVQDISKDLRSKQLFDSLKFTHVPAWIMLVGDKYLEGKMVKAK